MIIYNGLSSAGSPAIHLLRCRSGTEGPSGSRTARERVVQTPFQVSSSARAQGNTTRETIESQKTGATWESDSGRTGVEETVSSVVNRLNVSVSVSVRRKHDTMGLAYGGNRCVGHVTLHVHIHPFPPGRRPGQPSPGGMLERGSHQVLMRGLPGLPKIICRKGGLKLHSF